MKDAKGCFVKRDLTYFWLFSLWGGGRERPAFTFMKRENQRQSQHSRSEGVSGVAPGILLSDHALQAIGKCRQHPFI